MWLRSGKHQPLIKPKQFIMFLDELVEKVESIQLFPPPQQPTDSFMFHVVVGERIWLNETKGWVKLACSVGGLVGFLLTVYALWIHNVVLSMLFLAIIVVWKGLFVRYTARLSRAAGDTRLERAGISL